MDKEDVAHIYNGIVPLKKEKNSVICNNLDGPTCCHNEWSKSETYHKTNIVWYYLDVKFLKKDTNELTYRKEIES